MDIRETLLSILAIDSLTGQEKEMVEWLRRKFTGFECFQLYQEGLSLTYRSKPDPQKPTLVFYGHTDTVTNQQSRRPYLDSGLIYGCGASDMKGGLAVMIELMEVYRAKKNCPYNLIFVFYDQEEGPFAKNGLASVLEKQTFLRDCELAIVLEPTSNTIQSGCVGSLHARISFHGKSGHSARPWEGDNAIYKSHGFIKKLQERQPVAVECGGLCFYESITPTFAQGGQTRNSVPALFEMNLNYRFAPGKSIEQAKSELLAFAADSAKIELLEAAPSGQVVNPDHILLSEFQTKFNIPLKPKQAWTDIARLGLAGISAINFGPGDPSQAHQADEHIRIFDLQKNFEMLEQFLFLG